MTSPKPRAYSYIRFSTPDQAKGDSYRRQLQKSQEYAASHGLELDETSTYFDQGVSAFRGRNAAQGALREFLDLVEAGHVVPGSYLLVESLDRLSRAAILEAQGLFLQILQRGIILVTLKDGKEYSRETVTANPMDIIISILEMVRAHEESSTKKGRLKAAWDAKRSKALDRPLTAKCPAWLVLDKEAGAFRVLEDRAAIVRRVYEMTLQGVGQHTIAETLNREGVPTFGKAKHWQRSYVVKLLQSPPVMGTLVPHTYEETKEGKKDRRPLDPVPGYYPAVVDEDTYQRVQAMRLDTSSPLRGRHARSGQVSNIFGGLARCPHCGSTMTRVYKGRRGGRPFLVCTKAKEGAGCVYKSIPYQEVEDAFRQQSTYILDSCPADNAEGQKAQNDLEETEAAIMSMETALENLLDNLQAVRSPALAQRVQALEGELAALREEREALQHRAASTAGPLLVKRLQDLEMALEVDHLDRTKVNAMLRQVLSGVVLDYPTGYMRFLWKHGGESSLAHWWPEE